MSVGLRIKLAREQRNMTLEDVAKLCETTKQTIYKYENEIVTNIPYEKIVLLSKALDVSPSYLFGWEEKKSSPSEPQLTEGEKLMLKLFRQIPEDRQPEAIDLLRVALKMQQKP
jgi:transcriptional regulator with XRE-family HTH domain